MAVKRKKEFSKIIFVLVTVMVIVVVSFSLVMVWITRDLSPLSWLIPAVFAELAAITGFYFNKAKAENVKKIEKAGDEDSRPTI